MNMIELIAAGAQEELEDSERQTDLLKEIYENARNNNEKRIIDEVLVCICGWRYSTLKEMEDS